ncbi:5447_t:CDS:2 [Ambispora leptoticha]|uniref:5447_t:CDS:1 n=1 Tax=Ambispora leptoticha TaxID=144679 RepID=A0A9N8W4V5_9GLOM|nr:5447_t:CDS:2 [Ambispora leptoticha]
MCTLFWALQYHPQYKFVFAGNRDEFLSRPTALASWWNNSTILGGRDLQNPQNAGTWLGINRYGRFVAVTNYRGPNQIPKVKTVIDEDKRQLVSRGVLVKKILESQEKPLDEIMRVEIEATAENYGGYNIIAVDLANQEKNKTTNENNDDIDCHMFYFANRHNIRLQTLRNGEIYGISNSVLDDPWPKVEMGKREFRKILENKTLSENDITIPFKSTTSTIPEILEDIRFTIHVPECKIHETYATRTNTIVLVDHSNRVVFVERTVHDETRANNYCYSHISRDRFNPDNVITSDTLIPIKGSNEKESSEEITQQQFFESNNHKSRIFQFKIQRNVIN